MRFLWKEKNILKVGTYLVVSILFCGLLYHSFFLLRANLTHAAEQYALSFDGNDHVSMGDVTAIEGASQLTVEAWVKGSDFSNAIVIAKHGTGESGSFYLAYINANTIRFMVTNSSGSRVDHNVTVSLDTDWHHLAGVYDGSTMRVYLDGTQIGSTSAQTGTVRANDYQVLLGDYSNGGWDWVGQLDEVRIWNTARTAQEIQDNMRVEIETADGLVARWGMNEGTGSTVADSSGGGNTGTITGATWTTESPFGPAAITTLAPTSVLGTSATLHSSLTGLRGEDSVDVYFTYGTDPDNLDNTTATQTATTTGTFSQNISGLTPQTIYYFRAHADGEIANVTGDTISFGRTALSFDGNDRVAGGDLTAIEGAAQLTVEAWVKGSDFTEAVAVSKHGGGVGGSFYLAYIDANTVRFMVHNSSDERIDHDATYALDTEWHHFAGVYDGSTMRIYIDGVQIGGTSAQTGTIRANTVPFVVGNYGTGGIWPWTGQIDEVRVWDIARSPQEIAEGMYEEIETADGLVARWGMNEGSGSSVGDSSGGGNTGTITGATWVTRDVINEPASQPTLNAPTDEATDVSLSPTLSVTVESPDEDVLSVSFYGREYLTDGEDFTIMTIPDTQYYSKTYPATFATQTEWIVDTMDELNTQMVLHKGDVVDDGDTSAQWTNAMAALNTLKNNDIPTLVSIGNHDYDDNASTRAATFFNSNIDYTSWYLEKPWFDGGFFASSSENVYTKRTIGDRDFLFMTLEFGPRQDVIDWANDVVEAHPNHEVMIVTHNYMYHDDTRVGSGDSWNPHTYGIGSDANDGEEMWTEFVKLHENIFFVVSGHILGDGKGKLTSIGDNGNLVHQVLADYQVLSNGGNGYLRYYTFKPSERKIYAYSYSPTLDQFDVTADDEFILDYDFGSDYEILSASSSVEAGATVTHAWSDRSPDTTYEWYVAVFDGTSTTTSPVWTFTTESMEEPTDVPGAPTNVSAVANGTDTIDVSWDAPADDGGSAITGYKIERSVAGGGFSVLVADTESTDTVYEDTGLTSNILYAYRVSAINAEGTGAASSEASATTDAETPTVTTGVATDIGETAATLNGSLGTLGDFASVDVLFRFRIFESGDPFVETATQTATTTGGFSHALSELTTDTTYEFKAVVVWEDDGAQELEGDSVTFTTDPEVVPDTYALSVSLAGDGDGVITSTPAGITCGGDCAEIYEDTTEVTLSHDADEGSVFVGWSGACSGEGSCVVVMTEARSVTATFDLEEVEEETYLLAFDEHGGSSVSDVELQEGATTTLPTTTRSGFTFQNWNTASDGEGTSYAIGATYTMPASSTTLHAIWEEDEEEEEPTEEPEDEHEHTPDTRSTSSSRRQSTHVAGDTGGVVTVQSLLTQIKALLTQIVALGGSVPPNALHLLEGGTPLYVFTRDLTLDAVGEDVRALQDFLIAEASGPAAQALQAHGATGIFWLLTQSALAEYQASVGITPAVGFFGPVTRGYINARGL